MKSRLFFTHRAFTAFAALLLVAWVTAGAFAAETTVRIGTIGEPPMLDMQVTTANITSSTMQHVFETLLAFNGEWRPTPMLAKSIEVSEDGMLYTIELREGVLFHNGEEMDSSDAVASTKRWTRVSSRGKLAGGHIRDVVATGKYTMEIRMSQPFSPLPSFLAYTNGAATIHPKEVLEESGDAPIKEFIGTGPYKFVEWIPDRHIKLTKWEKYQPIDMEASGYAGRRIAHIDNLLFIPVPDVSTRVAGILSGDFDYVDALIADAYPRIQMSEAADPVMIKPFAWPVIIFNEEQGIMRNQLLRQAFQAALDMDQLMLGGFGNPSFFEVYGSIYPQGTQFYTEAGTENFNQADIEKAKELLRRAGYNGEPIRWMSSPQYSFLYNISLVAMSQLQQAGFNIDLQTVDWATLVDHRAKPSMWDAFITYHGFAPEPSLITIMSDTYPGWWTQDEKNQSMEELNRTSDPEKRKEVWSQIQALLFEHVHAIRTGRFFQLAAKSPKLQGLANVPQAIFWNATLSQ